MSEDGDVAGAITALIAVGTLPIGILAAMFMGSWEAAIVFVVGWFLLTPASAIVLDELVPAMTSDRKTEPAEGNPIEELRDRYARGEIDEFEFERRLDALLDTEGLDPDDAEAIEDAIDRLDAERDDEPEFERE